MLALCSLSVLLSLLPGGAAAPAADQCSQLIRYLMVDELPQVLGKWIFIEGVSNNVHFDSFLTSVKSLTMTLNRNANNQSLEFEQAALLNQQLRPSPEESQPSAGTDPCTRYIFNVTLVDDRVLETHFKVAHTYHRFLHTCPSCLTMHIFTKENDYQTLYLFGRNSTLPDSDLETFRTQAACLRFSQPAKFHFNSSDELCLPCRPEDSCFIMRV